MKRIVHVITGLDTGGAQMMLAKLLAATDRNACQSAVISLGDKGRIGAGIEELGIPVYSLDLRKPQNLLSSLFRIAGIMRRERPHVIQGWMYHGNFMGLLIRLFIRRKAVLLWNIRYSLYDLAREKPGTRLLIKLCALLSRLPAATVYNSKIAAAQHEKTGYSLTRHRIIPNGFDCRVFRPSAEARSRIRRELQIDDDAVVVGHVARFHPMKGHDVLLDAMALLCGRQPNVHFVLAGSGVTRSTILFRDFLERSSFSGRVHLLGEYRQIPALTASFDLAVSSSSWGEGFSNAVGEAMACGVPCVVTDVGDSAWIVGDAGLVVPPSQPRALAGAMERCILAGEAKRKAMGSRGRTRVESRFAIEEIAKKYIALYDDVSEALS